MYGKCSLLLHPFSKWSVAVRDSKRVFVAVSSSREISDDNLSKKPSSKQAASANGTLRNVKPGPIRWKAAGFVENLIGFTLDAQ